MDVRDQIAEMKNLMKTAERLALELDDAMNATPKSPRFDGMPRGNNQTTLDLQAEIIENARIRFEAARDNALEKLNEIEEKIDALENYDLQKILYFRHIYRMKWSEVAEKVHYSESYARRLHNKALKEMAENERNAYA